MTQETPRPAPGALDVRRVRTHHLREAKRRDEKFTMLTCYDALTAAIFDAAGVDSLLVGDSAGNNVLGHSSTLPVTVDELLPMCRAVSGAVERAFVVVDLPFGSYEASPEQAVASWLASPTHCANLMQPDYTEMGAAYVTDAASDTGIYWTQVLGKPAR